MPIEPNDLLLFARVVESGSFSRAAERVGLPKSTVSRRIAELERQLGERLLQRTTRKLTVTEFGFGVLDHARQVAEEVEGTVALALHRQAKPSGRLRVSMPHDIANATLWAMLGRFVREHPAIELVVDLSARHVDLIGESVDLALRAGHLAGDSQLAARRLALISVSLYASPEYLEAHGSPQTPEALRDVHGLMVLSRSGEPAPWMLVPGDGSAKRFSVLPVQRTLANSPELLMNLARSGAGIVAVSDYFVEPHVRAGQLRRVLPQWAHDPTPLWAVFPGRRLMPSKTRVFLDALSAELSKVCTDAEARCADAERRAREQAQEAALAD
ncbi:MAG TPA: LysR family transcriptional regulator [Burkholderiaceae bacterium]|nr:LysR family transcriptional regulator [Burkholderiaceae bacterium]